MRKQGMVLQQALPLNVLPGDGLLRPDEVQRACSLDYVCIHVRKALGKPRSRGVVALWDSAKQTWQPTLFERMDVDTAVDIIVPEDVDFPSSASPEVRYGYSALFHRVYTDPLDDKLHQARKPYTRVQGWPCDFEPVPFCPLFIVERDYAHKWRLCIVDEEELSDWRKKHSCGKIAAKAT